jgi:hypothetical protein
MAADHTSFSSLQQFDLCAMSWRAERVEKVKEPTSEILVIGIMVHDAAEGIVRYCEEQAIEQIPMDTVADIVQNVFVSNERAVTTSTFNDVMVASKIFAKSYHHRVGSVIELEQWLEGQLDEGLPKLVGRADFVSQEEDEQGPFIGNTDWKSGWAMNQTETNRFQLDLQGWLLKQSYPNERLKVRNWFIRAGQPTEWYELKAYDLDNARRRAIAIYQRMQEAFRKRAFPPSPGGHCGYCPISGRCEEALKLRENSHVILNVEDAQRIIMETQILASAVGARKKALKKFVDLAGPVVAERTNPDRGVVEKVEATYRMGAESMTISDYLKAYARIGNDVFALFGAPLKGPLKKLEDDPRLAGLWELRRGKPRFYIGKLGDDEGEE